MRARLLGKFFLGCFMGLALLHGQGASWAQAADPAEREDAIIERRKMLRAADQVEILTTQISRMQGEIQELKRELESVKNENYKLKSQLDVAETRRAKEREIILAEVAKNIAQAKRDLAQTVTKAAPTPRPVTPPAREEKGYEHVVEKGETLWMIAKAYRDQGVNVTVEDICRANNFTKDSILHIGQKLFVPQK